MAWFPSTFPARKHKDEAELLGLNVPLVAHNSGMHVIWQLDSRALLHHQSQAFGPVATWWLLAVPAPTSSHRFPSLSTPAETGIFYIVHTGSAFVLAS